MKSDGPAFLRSVVGTPDSWGSLSQHLLMGAGVFGCGVLVLNSGNEWTRSRNLKGWTSICVCIFDIKYIRFAQTPDLQRFVATPTPPQNAWLPYVWSHPLASPGEKLFCVQLESNCTGTLAGWRLLPRVGMNWMKKVQWKDYLRPVGRVLEIEVGGGGQRGRIQPEISRSGKPSLSWFKGVKEQTRVSNKGCNHKQRSLGQSHVGEGTWLLPDPSM